MKIDVLKVVGNVVVHKQYEHRDGRNYIRVKKRPLWMMRRNPLASGLFSKEGLGI